MGFSFVKFKWNKSITFKRDYNLIIFLILKYNIKLHTSMPKLVAGWVLGTHNF